MTIRTPKAQQPKRGLDAAAVPDPNCPAAQPIGLVVTLALAVAAITLAAHWPVLSVQALSFDDGQFLTDNPLVQNPSWASAGRFLSEILEPSTVEGYYLPLPMISLMLDYAAGGRPDNLRPFHRTSLGLHVINTALIIALLYILFGQPWPAALAGLLFGLHPLTVEPVAWVGERKTLLATFFALWFLILYVRYTRRARRSWYAASMVMYAAAVMSKPTAVPLPALLLLLDYWPLARLNWRTVIEKAPFFVMTGVFAVVTIVSHSRTAGIAPPAEHSAPGILLTMCYLLVFYLQKILWPVNLTCVYPLPEPLTLSNPTVLGGVIAACVLITALLISLRRTRALVTGWLVFFVAILPTLGLVRYSWVTASDKYVYLPSIGLLLVLAWSMGRVWSTRSGVPRTLTRRAGLIVLVLLLAAAQTRGTRRYLHCWQNTEGLFRHMVRLAPRAHMPHYDLGHCLQSQGRLDEAEDEYRTVLQINPHHADSHNNLGLILKNKGRIDEAVFHYAQALRINPRYANALANLGSALGDLGKYDEAIAQFRKAITVSPDDPRMHNALGTILLLQGKPDQAVSAFGDALRLKLDYPEALRNLASALARVGRTEEAVRAYTAYLKVNPSDPEALNALGDALFHRNELDKAAGAYRRALQLRPGYLVARKNLGVSLAAQGKIAEAITEYHAVLRVDPNDPYMHNNLGAALFDQGKVDEAVHEYHEALRLKPDYAAAHYNFACALTDQGMIDEAIEQYRAVLQINPSDVEARNRLEAALAGQRDHTTK